MNEHNRQCLKRNVTWKEKKILRPLKQFLIHRGIERKLRNFPVGPLPQIYTAAAIINVAPQCGVFVTVGESTLPHRHNHPKSIVCFMIHSRCCTFSQFGQMCNDLFPSLCYKQYFRRLKNPLCFACSLLPTHSSPLPPPQYLATTEFSGLHSFCFFQNFM